MRQRLPTALLTPREVEELLQVLRQLADDGTAIILVTHRLREVRAVADDVTVLRNGRNVATFTLPALAQREATDDNVGRLDERKRCLGYILLSHPSSGRN